MSNRVAAHDLLPLALRRTVSAPPAFVPSPAAEQPAESLEPEDEQGYIHFGSVSPSEPLLALPDIEVWARKSQTSGSAQKSVKPWSSPQPPSHAQPASRHSHLIGPPSGPPRAEFSSLRTQNNDLLQQLATSRIELALLQADAQDNSWLMTRLVAAEGRIAELEGEATERRRSPSALNGREGSEETVKAEEDAPLPLRSPMEARQALIVRELLGELRRSNETAERLLLLAREKEERVIELEEALSNARCEKAKLLEKLF